MVGRGVQNIRKKRGEESYRRGKWAEMLCAVVLTLKGYKIIAMRYKTKLGEIDLIAQRGEVVVFVEVKARPDRQKAGEAIPEKQQLRLRNAAALFLTGRPLFSTCTQRFDAMLVMPWRLPEHLESFM